MTQPNPPVQPSRELAPSPHTNMVTQGHTPFEQKKRPQALDMKLLPYILADFFLQLPICKKNYFIHFVYFIYPTLDIHFSLRDKPQILRLTIH